jgi:hypothetical protein
MRRQSQSPSSKARAKTARCNAWPVEDPESTEDPGAGDGGTGAAGVSGRAGVVLSGPLPSAGTPRCAGVRPAIWVGGTRSSRSGAGVNWFRPDSVEGGFGEAVTWARGEDMSGSPNRWGETERDDGTRPAPLEGDPCGSVGATRGGSSGVAGDRGACTGGRPEAPDKGEGGCVAVGDTAV